MIPVEGRAAQASRPPILASYCRRSAHVGHLGPSGVGTKLASAAHWSQPEQRNLARARAVGR
ncbi:MAG: hypothetical protein HY690_03895 [Chloroflexi bacterium]|nr:hypothetical protein [Chloroflexota bacterium]